MDLPQPRKFVLVVQTPDRKGNGSEFLVQQTDVAAHDLRVWKTGRSDQVVLALAQLTQTALHCRAAVGYKTFIRAIKEQFEITDTIRRIELDFTLPSRQEIASAAIRWNRVIFAQKEMLIEARILANRRRNISVRNRIVGFLTYLEKPNLLSGIRLHYERSLIADCKQDLVSIRKDLRSLRAELKAVRKLQAMSERKNTTALQEETIPTEPS